MSTKSKFAIAAGGYAAAFLIAWATVALFGAGMSAPDTASSGMAAFGDSLLFVAVFAVAALPATGAAIFFLSANRRPRRESSENS